MYVYTHLQPKCFVGKENLAKFMTPRNKAIKVKRNFTSGTFLKIPACWLVGFLLLLLTLEFVNMFHVAITA